MVNLERAKLGVKKDSFELSGSILSDYLMGPSSSSADVSFFAFEPAIHLRGGWVLKQVAFAFSKLRNSLEIASMTKD